MACNLKCPMCPVPRREQQMPGRAPAIMSLDTYRLVLKSVSDRPRRLHLNQMGEPLLNKNLPMLVEEAKKAGHHVSFTTNGTLMTRELAEVFLQLGTDKITFSVDGFVPATYESIRVGATYDTVRQNIEAMAELKQTMGGATHIQIDCISSEKTRDEIPRMQEYWGERLVPVRVLRLDDWGGRFELPNDLGARNSVPREAAMERYPCDLLWTTVAISAEGHVMYCCHDYKLQSDLASVHDRELRDVFCHDMAAERRKHVEGRIDSSPCLECDAWRTRSRYIDPPKSAMRRLIKKLGRLFKRPRPD